MISLYTNYIVVGLIAVVCGLTAWISILQVQLSRVRQQYARMMTGSSGHNLEETLNQHVERVSQVLDTVSALETHTRQMERTLRHSLQWLGIIRFNPFRNTGGAQSFALALVDGHGDGIVLSSLHARENTRVYAKPLHTWESTYTLTAEEEQAIARAHQQQA